ncbi:integrase arm-type DNA-binding domain-containing protein [Burkholderia cepacia]|uniref:integrase arm-type DNA-binding domain-containing protein n=1 Tax=Burkholderia cepacia TaxID=292 RepID=UPI002AB762D0|nr:Arm DNA-binding domain-containing protein [Burkholderia cepacia]
MGGYLQLRKSYLAGLRERWLKSAACRLRIAARSWVLRLKLDGRVREMGLGPLSLISLGEARKLAIGYREMDGNQIDPIVTRREEQRRRQVNISIDPNVTFREAAEAFIRVGEPGWRNRKRVRQWGNTLETYAYPIVGDVRVCDIDTAMKVRILQPIWTKKAERHAGCAVVSRRSSTLRP